MDALINGFWGGFGTTFGVLAALTVTVILIVAVFGPRKRPGG